MWIQSHSLSQVRADKPLNLGFRELGIIGRQGPEKVLGCWAAPLLHGGAQTVSTVRAPWLGSDHFSEETLKIKPWLSSPWEPSRFWEAAPASHKSHGLRKWILPLLITSQHFRGKGWLWLPRASKYLVSLERMGAHFPILTDFSVPSSFIKNFKSRDKVEWLSRL